jgi:hypothetical protein
MFGALRFGESFGLSFLEKILLLYTSGILIDQGRFY